MGNGTNLKKKIGHSPRLSPWSRDLSRVTMLSIGCPVQSSASSSGVQVVWVRFQYSSWPIHLGGVSWVLGLPGRTGGL